MALMKCSECGKEISDKAKICINCGFPLEEQLKKAHSESQKTQPDATPKSVPALDKTATFVKEARGSICQHLKSETTRDKESVENLVQEFDKSKKTFDKSQNSSREMFKSALESTIDLKFAEIMKAKNETEKFLNYIDAQILTAATRNIYKTILNFTPPQIDAACELSEKILAPSEKNQNNFLRAIVGFGGGAVGIGIILNSISNLTQKTVWQKMADGIVGPSNGGEIIKIIIGICIAAISGYFAFSKKTETNTERFLKVFKSANFRAVDDLWPQYGNELEKAICKKNPHHQPNFN